MPEGVTESSISVERPAGEINLREALFEQRSRIIVIAKVGSEFPEGEQAVKIELLAAPPKMREKKDDRGYTTPVPDGVSWVTLNAERRFFGRPIEELDRDPEGRWFDQGTLVQVSKKTGEAVDPKKNPYALLEEAVVNVEVDVDAIGYRPITAKYVPVQPEAATPGQLRPLGLDRVVVDSGHRPIDYDSVFPPTEGVYGDEPIPKGMKRAPSVKTLLRPIRLGVFAPAALTRSGDLEIKNSEDILGRGLTSRQLKLIFGDGFTDDEIFGLWVVKNLPIKETLPIAA